MSRRTATAFDFPLIPTHASLCGDSVSGLLIYPSRLNSGGVGVEFVGDFSGPWRR
jgi:hypothetical protein